MSHGDGLHVLLKQKNIVQPISHLIRACMCVGTSSAKE